MSGAIVLGIDVGGTGIKGLAVGDGIVLAEHRVPTPSPDPTGERVVTAVSGLAATLVAAAGEATGIGVVIPGIVDEEHGSAVFSAAMGWRDVALRDMLVERLGRPVAFGHDVRAGAIAESRWGAAAGMRGVVSFVPVGTGIAAATLVGGHPVVSGGWAGEIGQLRIPAGLFAGLRVEEVASAAGIARRAGAPDARTVARRVAEGDHAATAVWNEGIDVLADALAGLSAAVAPELVVLGGGLALSGDILFSPLTAALTARLEPLRAPRLEAAALGDRAAALGAAAIAAGGQAP